MSPQHVTEPSSSIAHAWAAPIATSSTPLSAGVTGDGRSVVVPSPSCPCAFAPQQRSVASDITAQLACTPTTTFVGTGFTAAAGASAVTAPASAGFAAASFAGAGAVDFDF